TRRQASIRVFVPLALFRRAAQLVEAALRAPRVGFESFLACEGQHVAVRAELAVLRRGAPAARLEFLNRSRERGYVRRGRGRRFRGWDAGRSRWCAERIRVVHHPCNSGPKDRCSASSARSSSGATSVKAVPVAAARPVRPTRCTYISRDEGTSKFTTCVMPSMSSPRAATSVATST